MKLEIKIPSPGESITEVEIASWLKEDGDYVAKDEPLCSIESDKVTLDLVAEEAGELHITVPEGEMVTVGSVIGYIDTSVSPPEEKPAPAEKKEEPLPEPVQDEPAKKYVSKITDKPTMPLPEPTPEEEATTPTAYRKPDFRKETLSEERKATSATERESPVDSRVGETEGKTVEIGYVSERRERRKRLSRLRQKIAERLVSVKNETAMLTTFNEVDMSRIIQLRQKYKEEFKLRHNVGLGYMSFFTKAVVEALKQFPEVNASLDGNEIVYHDYMDIGVAVSTPRGLMVPVIRNAERLSFAEIEQEIQRLAEKARDNTITIEEMTGGTFTITNGGVFGSLLSTPIINPPQTAILGMHKIMERPVALNGEIVIRPMMYLALSYDHRLIDGREAVSFLVTIKELLEDPSRLLLGD